VRRNFRKPLIVMTPKSLLRHKLAVSPLADMAAGSRFKRVIPEIDTIAKDADVKRLIFTSGKLYYELLEARREQKIDDIALVRVEQYYPFPALEIEAALKKYPGAEVAWAQEEPQNMGAWTFIRPRINDVMEAVSHSAGRSKYIGRKEAASPAEGYMKLHTKTQQQIVADAMTLELAAQTKQKKKA
jgi:2-oxoglutarate dehydrogenase E1 component